MTRKCLSISWQISRNAIDAHTSDGASQSWLLLIAGIAILPLVIAVVVFLVKAGLPDRCLDIDMAMLELYTRHAINGEQLLGPYSRFGWNHPGPAYFYLLAPLYWFSGGSASSLFLSARIINALCGAGLAVMIVAVLGKRDRVLACWSLVLLTAYVCRLGPQVLANPWNPWIIIIPFALLLFCLASLAAGHLTCMPLAVFLASFVVQTHVGLVPGTLALIAASLLFLSRQGRLQGVHRSGWTTVTSVGLAVVIGIAMWLPPVVEELSHDPGNLSRLLAFFTSSGGKETALFDGFPTLARQLAWPPLLVIKWLPFTMPAFEYDLLAEAFAIVQAIATLFVIRASMRRGLHVRAALALLGGVGILAGILSLLKVRGDVFPYLIAWTSAIGMVNWMVMAAWGTELVAGKLDPAKGFGRVASRLGPPAALIAVALMAAAYLPGFISASMRPPGDSAKVKKLSRDLITYLRDHHVQRPLIHFNWSHWSVETGVIVQLSKAGQDFAVKNTWAKHPKQWPLLFTDAHDPRGDEDRIVIFGGKALQSNPGFTCIGAANGTYIYVTKTRDAEPSRTGTGK